MWNTGLISLYRPLFKHFDIKKFIVLTLRFFSVTYNRDKVYVYPFYNSCKRQAKILDKFTDQQKGGLRQVFFVIISINSGVPSGVGNSVVLENTPWNCCRFVVVLTQNCCRTEKNLLATLAGCGTSDGLLIWGNFIVLKI